MGLFNKVAVAINICFLFLLFTCINLTVSTDAVAWQTISFNPTTTSSTESCAAASDHLPQIYEEASLFNITRDSLMSFSLQP